MSNPIAFAKPGIFRSFSTVVGVPLTGIAITFTPVAFLINNYTELWAQIEDTDDFIPPLTGGFVIGASLGRAANIVWNAPPGVTQPTVTNPKATLKITATDQQIPYSPGSPLSTIYSANVPAPASTVTGPDAYGAPAVVGTGTTYARDDHDHGLPAAVAVPSPAATVTGPDAYGAPAVVGTGTTYARDDHDHGLPAAPAPSLTSVSAFLAANVALSGSGIHNLMSINIPSAGTWLVTWQATWGNSAGVADFYISDASAGPLSGSVSAATAQDGTSTSGSAIIVTTGATTYYMNLDTAAASGDVYATTETSGAANATGIVAVRIA